MKYSLKRLWKNLNFLMKYNLKEREENLKIDILDEVEDVYIYEIKDNADCCKKLKVLDSQQTVDLLLRSPKSFCRFGDGEIEIMKGNNISFQRYDKRLAEILLNILKNESEDLYVGLTHGFFSTTKSPSEFVRRWNRLYVKKYRDFFINNCNHSRTYIDTGFNQISVSRSGEDLDDYYNKIKKLFKDRELIVFAGEGVLDKLKYDIFELAKSKEFVYGPNKNSFSKFDELLKKALEYPKDKTFVFILGPCSKALCFYLSQKGRMAWDLGHLPKSYDFYMNATESNAANIESFYKPD